MAINGRDIVEYLKQFIGTPYVWGGNSLSKGVDCSGLVQ
ncbi:MAG TPA: NlpC/P60 family protein, partial [Candidatus Paceibacterota bacterium]